MRGEYAARKAVAQPRRYIRRAEMTKCRPYCYCQSCRGELQSLQNFNLRLRDHNSPLNGLQRIITNCAGRRESNVNDGIPALQFVMSVAMKNIGRANGNTRRTRFHKRKPGVIIHGVIGQKYFLAAAAPHVERGEVVQSTCGRDSSK